tara:strand:+ start:1453 stop:1683 length:231 start_codon:yes stop_codon:yes gene_type:complete
LLGQKNEYGYRRDQEGIVKKYPKALLEGVLPIDQENDENKKGYPSGKAGDRCPEGIIFLDPETIEVHKGIFIPFLK